jgi:hypothetical protein
MGPQISEPNSYRPRFQWNYTGCGKLTPFFVRIVPYEKGGLACRTILQAMSKFLIYKVTFNNPRHQICKADTLTKQEKPIRRFEQVFMLLGCHSCQTPTKTGGKIK